MTCKGGRGSDMKGHVVAIVSLAAFCASAGEWQFFSAPAAPAMAAGEVRSDGAVEIRDIPQGVGGDC